MNTQIHDAFINAVLADSAYVNGLTAGLTGEALADALTERLTAPLAAYIGANLSVVTQFTDPDPINGFSVTVFQDLANGQRYVSFRGMEGIGNLADSSSAANVLFLTGLAQGHKKGVRLEGVRLG